MVEFRDTLALMELRNVREISASAGFFGFPHWNQFYEVRNGRSQQMGEHQAQESSE
jgi:hypothetical protein